jgi:alpha-beta hydrolase superfamily lysophospholipase
LRSYHIFPFYRPGNALLLDSQRNCFIPRAIVIYCPDIGLHSAHCMHLFYNLARLGYAVHSFDYPGFGESQGTRGNIQNYRNLIREVLEFALYARKMHENDKKIRNSESIRMYIGGSGFGACLAMCASIENSKLFSGLMLLSPAIQLDCLNSLQQSLIKALAPVFPRTNYGCLYKLDQLSRNLSVSNHFEYDPLIFKSKYNLHTLNELFQLSRAAKIIIPHLKLPFLVQHGLRDLIYSPLGSRLLLTNSNLVAAAMKRLIGLGRCWSELLHENEWEVVIQYCTEWLETTEIHYKLLNTMD